MFINYKLERSYQMNSLIIKGNWNESVGKLKQQFANLTDADLLFKQIKLKRST